VKPSSIITFTLWGFQEKREKKGQKNLLEEIIDENFPHLAKEADIQI